MKIRLQGTRKRNIIILAVFAVVFLGSGLYLLWRVNQPDTVAPTDSDAGGANRNKCVPECWVWDNTRNDWVCGGEGCGTFQCGNGAWICAKTANKAKSCTDCGHTAPGTSGEGGGCSQGAQCPACEYPNVAYCDAQGKCGCKPYNNIPSGSIQCGKIVKCDPPECPSGKVSCGVSGDGKDKTGCEKSGFCDTQCSECLNKSKVYRYCKEASSNVCDSGEWLKRPQGTYKYCDPVEYSFVAKDKDGIKSSSILVKLNNTNRPSLIKTAATTQTTVSEILSTTDDCLDPGTYNISAEWADSLGATATSCTLATSFTVLAAETNPNWEIEKAVVEQCIDEDTENSSALLSYTVTVTNTGDGSGQLDKIIDELDTKVLEEYLGSISSDGVYTDGTIVWDLEGATETFEAGEDRTYTYTITVPFVAFGTYSNTVTAYPREGDSVIDTAVIDADCEITTPEEEEDLPDTGVFDDIRVAMLLGAGLILVGISWNKMSGSFLLFGNVVANGKKNREEKIVKGRREKLEKKVVKR